MRPRFELRFFQLVEASDETGGFFPVYRMCTTIPVRCGKGGHRAAPSALSRSAGMLAGTEVSA
jgi:hypothetical protein